MEGENIVTPTEEVEIAVEGAPETPTLPSDAEVFEMPEKFAGKTAEEIAQSYLELEKFKASKEEAPAGEPTPDDVDEPNEDEGEAQYNKYAESYDKNGGLSEAEYAELAEAGYDKATVDKEIEYRKEQNEFKEYKSTKALNDVLEPLGGGAEKFKEVGDWANQNKTPEEVVAFNEALAGSTKLGQQALLKSLYAEYDAGNTSDDMLHTNTPQRVAGKGYVNEAALFADMDNPSYKNDKNYAAQVQEKLGKTDTSKWSW